MYRNRPSDSEYEITCIQTVALDKTNPGQKLLMFQVLINSEIMTQILNRRAHMHIFIQFIFNSPLSQGRAQAFEKFI